MVYKIDYYIANNVIILVGDGGLICQMNLSGCLNHKVVINEYSLQSCMRLLMVFIYKFNIYQELKSNESKNEREEKKGLKNKKKQKKELNDTAS